MKRIVMTALMGTALMGLPVVTGCDRTVEEKHTVEQKRDGTVEQEHKKTTVKPDGTVMETKTETVDK